jgi:hypothetical protein
MNDVATEPNFEIIIPNSQPTKGEREYQAFLRLQPELLRTHWGQYVAIHEFQMLDADADDIALVRRVHARIGYVPIHVALVTEQPSLIRVPHYREYRPEVGK